MNNKYKINDLNGLKARQMALLAESERYSEAITTEAKSYVEDFSVANFFEIDSKPTVDLKLKKPDSSSLLSGKILSLALPLILNKTIFRGSGLMTRAAVGMMSSKTGAKIGGHLVKYISKLTK